ncbi:short-chain dehydrogenase/reductase family protein [Francisella tularensis subsp. holarctica FSC022]|uniref:SDR family oxidoreductase n=2 Tax=Francisella tularensis TaxID=263 RepID=UPI00015D786F|nr:SDR family oxidoreductase [Francisella tularensis]EDO66770.1 short-chain dehydrogenase/reductase family protein [Francisella tularensis subsp. holarctica FSC022]KIP30525.1 short chain dehydrogenase family protein [Francisella tularensis subsp. holarctica]MBK2243860.1 SDR family oxidoreductase [Francisella tularensis]MCC9172190.1 SDR family oxidoreductase [Francisella tularensis]
MLTLQNYNLIKNSQMTKNILITGANGGIGSAIALVAAEAGYNIGLHYHINNQNIDKIKKQLAQYPIQISTHRADIANEEDVREMFNEFISYHGSMYALINNASTIFHTSRLEDMSIDRLQKVFQVNAIGNILCAKHAIKKMSRKYGYHGGKIINISSSASRSGSPNEYIDYACTKGAIDTLTKGLSKELADEGILVNCIRPGSTYTDIHKLSGDADRVNKIKHKIPLKRGGYPEEIASGVIWLLSDGANYCTGTFIDIAGGK